MIELITEYIDKVKLIALLFVAITTVACQPIEPSQPPTLTPTIATPSEAALTADRTKIVPPIVALPCVPDECPFSDKIVTVIVSDTSGESGLIAEPLYEIKDEFEAATGASLEIIEKPIDEHFAFFITDLTTGTGVYDASIAGAWWLGDLVTQDFILPYDDFYVDPQFPVWDIADVQPAPRTLLIYDGQKYMVPNDHDGQVMYYRRDLLANSDHQTTFLQIYGYSLDVPQTWAQFRDVAEYFDDLDLNNDGQPDDGLTLNLKVGRQGVFNFISFSAPFVIGPNNPHLYWFDPVTLEPLLNSPGHVRALETMVDLIQFGSREMLNWDLSQSWDHFLRGEAALTFTFGDLGGLAQEEGSFVQGSIGAAPMPGTMAYYNLQSGKWESTTTPNRVGNTTGGSWAGVISKFSDAPEATYYLLALLATKEKSLIYAARGWDGVDPGRYSHYLPPRGTADISVYHEVGWNDEDLHLYTDAYYQTFNNPYQVPYLRIPGAFSYFSALDIHLFEAVQGQLTAQQALAETVLDFEELTNRLGRDNQAEIYRASLDQP